MRTLTTKGAATAFGLLCVSGLALTGCSSDADAQNTDPQTVPSQGQTADAVNTMESGSENGSSAVNLPECDAMNASAQQEHEDFGPDQFTYEAGEVELPDLSERVSPDTMEPLNKYQPFYNKASSSRICFWPGNFEGHVVENVSEVDARVRDEAIDQMRKDELAESKLGNVTVFRELVVPEDSKSDTKTHVYYMFVDDVWITVINHGGGGEYNFSALDGVVAANPELVQLP